MTLGTAISQRLFAQVGGGAHLNQPAGGNNNVQGIDLQAATQQAQNDKGEDSGLFSQALGFLQNKQAQGDTDVDEDGVQDAHDKAYNQGQASNMSSSGLGAAAAMQAMKSFTGGSSSGSSMSGGGGMQAKLIGMVRYVRKSFWSLLIFYRPCPR
jgi:hypothetical protein